MNVVNQRIKLQIPINNIIIVLQEKFHFFEDPSWYCNFSF